MCDVMGDVRKVDDREREEGESRVVCIELERNQETKKKENDTVF